MPPQNAILERWEQVLSNRKDAPAILGPDGSVAQTFFALEKEARRWADRLPPHAPGSALALQMGNVIDWPAILLAAWRTGWTVVPFDSDLTGEPRARIEELCGVSLRIACADREEISLLPGTGLPVNWPSPGPDFLKLTSGSSGEARAVRFGAAQLLADCDTICDTMGIGPDDRNYGVISFAHSYGFSNLITPLLCRGVPLVVAGDMMPRALLDGLAKSEATVFPAVPAVFRALAGFRPPSRSLRLCVSAGAPLSAEVARDFKKNWSLKIHSFYGASECGGICYDGGDDEVTQGFVGPPMKNVTVGHGDGSGPGLLEVRSAAVGLGYHPAGEGKFLQDGCFRPADLLEKIPNGYVIRGRISASINVAGRKVSPREIERVIAECGGVREVAVLGLPAVTRGEEIAACVAGEVTEDALKAHCAQRLPPWQVPRHWRIVESLPVNARGKTARETLRALFLQGSTTQTNVKIERPGV